MNHAANAVVQGLFRLVLLASSLLVQGCATYYVSAANDFTSVAASLKPALDAADAGRLRAANDFKLSLIAQDRNCPIAGANVYLRQLLGPGSTVQIVAQHPGVEAALRYANGGNLPESCQQLLACEQGPPGRACGGVCYAESEVPCLNQLGLLVQLAEVHASGSAPFHWDDAERNALRASLDRARFPQTEVLKGTAFADALKGFGAYLDLLKTASTPEKTALSRALSYGGVDLKQSLTTDAKTLSNKVETARKDYDKVSEHMAALPHMGGVTDANLTKELGAFGALVQTLNDIAASDGSEKAIRDVVEKHKTEVNAWIQALGDDLEREVADSFNYQSLAALQRRHALEEEFRREPDAAKRSRIVEEVQSIDAPGQARLASAVDSRLKASIAKIVEAHETLIRMLDNPSKTDEKKKLEAGLDTLRSLASEIAALVAIYK